MPLLARTVATPLVIDIRPKAISALPTVLADGRVTTTGRVGIAIGGGVGESIRPLIEDVFPDSPIFRVDGATMDVARQLQDFIRTTGVEALAGIGGGGTIDVGKYAASLAAVPFVAVATTLTHDGLASPVAVLDVDGVKGSFGVHIPLAVLIDLNLVRECPEEHIRSGVGDTVSNLSACADWELAQEVNNETVDGLAASMARSAGEAVVDYRGALNDPAFLTTLADSLVLSGLSMAVAGSSRPCSGACHEFSHAFNALFPGSHLHGESVAVGTLFASMLRDDPLTDRIDETFKALGVPRLPGDIGLTKEQFVQAVEFAPETRPGRFTILEHLDMDRHEIDRQHDRLIERFD